MTIVPLLVALPLEALDAVTISVDIPTYSSSGVDQFRQVLARLAHRELAHDRLEAYVSSRG